MRPRTINIVALLPAAWATFGLYARGGCADRRGDHNTGLRAHIFIDVPIGLGLVGIGAAVFIIGMNLLRTDDRKGPAKLMAAGLLVPAAYFLLLSLT